LPAVGEHDDEEREPAARVANCDGAKGPPVDLRTFAGSEVQFEVDGQLYGPDAANVITHNANAAAISLLPQALEDLLSAVGMRVEQAGDPWLEGIKDAAAWMALLGCVAWTRQPLGDGLAVQTERAGDLNGGQALTIPAVVDLCVRLVVDHDPCGQKTEMAENTVSYPPPV
jgi:hypothetical protein